MPARRRVDPAEGRAAADASLAALRSGEQPAVPPLRTAVRFLLEELAARHPGNSVEVRVPPYGVTQCLPGPRHTRGTPPNVVETDAVTWLLLCGGGLSWAEAVAEARVAASGERADLREILPLA